MEEEGDLSECETEENEEEGDLSECETEENDSLEEDTGTDGDTDDTTETNISACSIASYGDIVDDLLTPFEYELQAASSRGDVVSLRMLIDSQDPETIQASINRSNGSLSAFHYAVKAKVSHKSPVTLPNTTASRSGQCSG